MKRTHQHAETPSERAARWAAEEAQAKPRSRLAEVSGELVPRLLGGLVVVCLFGTIAYVAVDIVHRGRPGGTKAADWIKPGTCFRVDPGTYFTGSEPVGALPTVDCADEHRAEAYYGFNVAQGQDTNGECERAWSQVSKVPVSVSGIQVTTLVKSAENSIDPQQALCVAVGNEPVKGLSLASWKPSAPASVPTGTA